MADWTNQVLQKQKIQKLIFHNSQSHLKIEYFDRLVTTEINKK